MTPFQFDHEFRARAPAVLFEAYFDAEQAAEQDALTGIERREVLERVEDDATLRRVCRVRRASVGAHRFGSILAR